MMFDKEYTFYGDHAEKVRQLVFRYSELSAEIFARNVDVLLIAPVVGFLYGRTAKVDRTNSLTTKIFLEQMLREARGLKFNYQLITLLNTNSHYSKDERINKAFRNLDKEEEITDSLSCYDEYILGGVEVLHEKLIAQSSAGDYLNNLYDFLEDVNQRYNQSIQADKMMELVDLARSR